MGRSYSNITIKAIKQNVILEYLRQLNRSAYVSPTINDFTVIYDKKSEDDTEQLFKLAETISEKFSCSALAIFIDDESVFCYVLYDRGLLLDEYISDAGFYNSRLGSFPKGGDAKKICQNMGIKKAANLVRSILREPTTEKTYLLASQRHRDFAHKLGLPIWSTDAIGGYQDIEEEEVDAVIFDEDNFSDLNETLSRLKKTFEY